ncbi:MAG: methyl-accepting chemotaxis protein [ANME-2 cluster archaeon]|nr:methyl-accepting chemotaxis protein [ANME-2 cluster archaeon]
MKVNTEHSRDVEDTFDMDSFILQDEREHMLFELHRYLVWVGEPLPEDIDIDGHQIKLHDLIWKLTQKEKLTENERKCIKGLIQTLEQKEKLDEERIEKANLTRAQAEQLHDEAAGLLRAIMDLKDLEEGRIKKADFDEASTRDRVQDARRWMNFMKQMKD